MRTLALWAIVFAITVLETWIATWEGRADRQSTSAKHNWFSIKAALWAGAFEFVLFVDIQLLVKEGWWLLVPILAGAVWGKYHALERRRAKFRSRTKRAKRAKTMGVMKAGNSNEPATAVGDRRGSIPGGNGDEHERAGEPPADTEAVV